MCLFVSANRLSPTRILQRRRRAAFAARPGRRRAASRGASGRRVSAPFVRHVRRRGPRVKSARVPVSRLFALVAARGTTGPPLARPRSGGARGSLASSRARRHATDVESALGHRGPVGRGRGAGHRRPPRAAPRARRKRRCAFVRYTFEATVAGLRAATRVRAACAPLPTGPSFAGGSRPACLTTGVGRRERRRRRGNERSSHVGRRRSVAARSRAL